MDQLTTILTRLKKPSVLTSLAAQITTLLLLFNVEIDTQLITGIITVITTILVLLGIVSNPDTQNQTYGDDLYFCPTCNKMTPHVLAGGNMLCPECATINDTISVTPTK